MSQKQVKRIGGGALVKKIEVQITIKLYNGWNVQHWRCDNMDTGN